MTTIEELVIKIKSDVRNAIDGLKQVEANTKKMASTQQNVLANLKKHWKAYAVAVGAAAGAIGVMVKWAAEEEAVSVRTAALLRQQGIEWNKVSKSLDAYFKHIEKITTYNDTEVQEAFNQLIVTGVDYNTALENLIMVTRVAYSTNLDLRTAAMYVGRAIEGDANMLARYIPAIRKLNEEQRTWANILPLLNEMMADSTARGESLQGAIDNLNNQFHNVVEAGGTELLQLLRELAGDMAALAESDSPAKFAAVMRMLVGTAKVVVNSFTFMFKVIKAGFVGLEHDVRYVYHKIKGTITGNAKEIEKANKILEEEHKLISEIRESAEEDARDLNEAYRRIWEAEQVLINGTKKLHEAGTKPPIDPNAVKTSANALKELEGRLGSLTKIQREWLAAGGFLGEGGRFVKREEVITPESRKGIRKAKPSELVFPVATVTAPTPAPAPPPVAAPAPVPSVPAMPSMPSAPVRSAAKEELFCGLKNTLSTITKELEVIKKEPKRININVHIDKIVSEEDYTSVSKKVAAAIAMGAGPSSMGVR